MYKMTEAELSLFMVALVAMILVEVLVMTYLWVTGIIPNLMGIVWVIAIFGQAGLLALIFSKIHVIDDDPEYPDLTI